MPSRYEPCGLNQMYSLRYGTIPVVHATGGLDDSVIDVFDHPDSGTGFKFYRYEPEAFFEAIESSLELFKELKNGLRFKKEPWIRIFPGRSLRANISRYTRRRRRQEHESGERGARSKNLFASPSF